MSDSYLMSTPTTTDMFKKYNAKRKKERENEILHQGFKSKRMKVNNNYEGEIVKNISFNFHNATNSNEKKEWNCFKPIQFETPLTKCNTFASPLFDNSSETKMSKQTSRLFEIKEAGPQNYILRNSLFDESKHCSTNTILQKLKNNDKDLLENCCQIFSKGNLKDDDCSLEDEDMNKYELEKRSSKRRLRHANTNNNFQIDTILFEKTECLSAKCIPESNFMKNNPYAQFKTPTPIKCENELNFFDKNKYSMIAEDSSNFEYRNSNSNKFSERAIRMEQLSCQSFESLSGSQSDFENQDDHQSISFEKNKEEIEIPVESLSKSLKSNNDDDMREIPNLCLPMLFEEVSFHTPPHRTERQVRHEVKYNKNFDKVNRRLLQSFKYLPSEERKETRCDQIETLQCAPKKKKRGSSLTSKNGNSREYSPQSEKIK